jgi:cyclopropane-fatty-acyl-phospholipid synthase
MIDGWAERVVLQALEGLEVGRLVVELPGGTRTFGPGPEPAGVLRVRHPRLFRRVLGGGEIALGESFMDGDWTTPDLVALIRLMLANRAVFDGVAGPLSWLSGLVDGIRHRIRDNTKRGSRRNIHAHYDLGNAFFSLFLDVNLMYSCALYDGPEQSLEAAQVNKLRTICRKLDLGPADHVVEIGTGWGGFAVYAATRHGCRVTTITISQEQYDYAVERCRAAGEAGSRIEVRLEDYRDLRGRYDKLVSIEMFEAVGHRHYDTFFGVCDRLLNRDGVMLLQTITVDDQRFASYLGEPNWIAKYIFPGAELASVGAILASLTRATGLGLFHAEQIGTHYARTLHAWRARFQSRLGEVRAQGFDDRFIRMWDLYLGYCEAAFLDRHIGDVQLLLAKAGNRRVLFGEPWLGDTCGTKNEERRTKNATKNDELSTER